MTAAIRSTPADDPQAEAIRKLHGWCPDCDGNGMVMEFQPTDCPNLDMHRFIQELEQGATLLSRQDAADLLGVDLRALIRLMDSELLPFTIVGKTYVFRYRDVQTLRTMIRQAL